jgi:hypothetical protein
MASSAVQDKAAGYLFAGIVAEPRVRITYATDAGMHAFVTGTNLYDVTWYADRGWHCTCPATRTCCHLTAVRAVWRPAEEE